MENLEIDAESNSKTHVYIFLPFSVYLAVKFSITVKITINVFFHKNKISAQKMHTLYSRNSFYCT
jgi:hypothetical protein